MKQGIEFLDALPVDIYHKGCKGVFDSTIGGHFRHNLDHYAAFLDGIEDGEIDYDSRPRDPAVEEHPEKALALLESLCARFGQLDETKFDQPVKIRMDDGGDSAWSQTTLRRELQFLLSHAIHHYALVATISGQMGFDQFPENFGIAPSTLHYQQSQGT